MYFQQCGRSQDSAVCICLGSEFATLLIQAVHVRLSYKNQCENPYKFINVD